MSDSGVPKILLVDIYKTLKTDEMYLYVSKADGLSRVPEQLLATFGNPIFVTTLKLTPDRKLARADAAKVLINLSEQGFYLQMPPPLYSEMSEIGSRNDKLPRA